MLTSPVSKPVTASEKVNLTLRAVVELIFAGTPPIATASSSSSRTVIDRVIFPYSCAPIRDWYFKLSLSLEASSSSSAVIVTVCGSDQFDVVNIRAALSTVTSVPSQPVTSTVVEAGTGPDSDTLCSVLPPSKTSLPPCTRTVRE